LDILYECMLLMEPTLPDSEVSSILDHLEETVVGAGGEFDCVNLLGKERLAYSIADHAEGIRALLYFRGPTAVAELKREMLVTAGILRGMVVVANPRALRRPGEPTAAQEAPAAPAAEEEAVAGSAAPEEEPAEEEEAPEEPTEEPEEPEEEEAGEQDEASGGDEDA
jgi:small subunit ribosomal protein S6